MSILEQNPQQGVIVPKIAPISGRYYSHLTAFPGIGVTSALAANAFYAVPFQTPVTFTADRIQLNVTVAAAAGKLLRLGLYAATGAGLPGALVLQTTDIAADTAAPFVASGTISQVITAGQLYFLVVVSDDTPTVTAVFPSQALLGSNDSTDTISRATFQRTFTYGALPDPWGTPTTYTSITPRVALRAV